MYNPCTKDDCCRKIEGHQGACDIDGKSPNNRTKSNDQVKETIEILQKRIKELEDVIEGCDRCTEVFEINRERAMKVHPQ